MADIVFELYDKYWPDIAKKEATVKLAIANFLLKQGVASFSSISIVRALLPERAVITILGATVAKKVDHVDIARELAALEAAE